MTPEEARDLYATAQRGDDAHDQLRDFYFGDVASAIDAAGDRGERDPAKWRELSEAVDAAERRFYADIGDRSPYVIRLDMAIRRLQVRTQGLQWLPRA